MLKGGSVCGRRHYGLGFLLLLLFSYLLPSSFAQAPGGVSPNLAIWLRADTGITTNASGEVTLWADQSSSGNDMSEHLPANDPALLSSDINFNPLVDFSSDRLQDVDGIMGSGTHNNMHAYIVLRTDTIDNTIRRFFLEVGSGTFMQLFTYSVGTAYNFGPFITGSALVQASSAGILQGGYQVWTLISSAGSSLQQIKRDGVSIATESSVGAARGENLLLVLGDYIDAGVPQNQFFHGAMAEFIIYLGDLDLSNDVSNETGRIESYLAIKYGQTLPHHYVNSAGTIVRTVSGAYTNNIAGIARDDASALNQKQSQSVNADVVAMALGSFAVQYRYLFRGCLLHDLGA